MKNELSRQFYGNVHLSERVVTVSRQLESAFPDVMPLASATLAAARRAHDIADMWRCDSFAHRGIRIAFLLRGSAPAMVYAVDIGAQLRGLEDGVLVIVADGVARVAFTGAKVAPSTPLHVHSVSCSELDVVGDDALQRAIDMRVLLRAWTDRCCTCAGECSRCKCATLGVPCGHRCRCWSEGCKSQATLSLAPPPCPPSSSSCSPSSPASLAPALTSPATQLVQSLSHESSAPAPIVSPSLARAPVAPSLVSPMFESPAGEPQASAPRSRRARRALPASHA